MMASTVLFVRNLQQGWAMLAWFALFGLLIVLSSVLSVPAEERKAGRAFRRGDYAAAADLYRALVEKRPLARNYAFLGAALGASGRLEESVEASTEAINRDPEYGLAYYNRALVLRQLRKKSRARKDLERALEADLPRRFRSAVRGQLEELR
ncbi:Tetratricopeptide TPR_2 [Rubrobacter xylanophilus DSM 9941]|uniref:Tetratricopeptide TPR_2 n=1 Tax=Rubrobacter xylanophilus (strain DSM 9941 / JCM 11954 / NBRC 16129 / PRD-1) TaxID=266117 RepID=Q1AS48_RUBXD|nr:Tetratricopeptide TPR_2 [Rubrobacter xylanophilus DSM 9941]